MDSKEHARQLLRVFRKRGEGLKEEYVEDNNYAIECAEELVRLLEMADPDKDDVDVLLSKLETDRGALGCAWIDLSMCANRLRPRQRK